MLQELIDSKISSYANKKTDIGIGGFTLGVTIEESMDMTATVATSYIESGDYVNDHITNAPLTLTISGEAGDIHVKESARFSDYKKLGGTVGKLTPYFPKRTSTQVTRIFGFINTVGDKLRQIDGYIEDGLGLYNVLSGAKKDKKQTPQEEFLQFFTMVHENRLFINVEAFDKVFENMAMQSLSIKKSEGNFIAYSFTFVQLRFAQTTSVNIKKNKGLKSGKKKGNNAKQMDGKKDKGTVTPKEPNNSVLTNIKKALF